jgi:hypothetical protein
MAPSFVSYSTHSVEGHRSTVLVDALVGDCVYIAAGNYSTDVGPHTSAFPTTAGAPWNQ